MVSEFDKAEQENSIAASNNPKEVSSPPVSHILDEVLEEVEEVAPRHNRHPLFIDMAMTVCLLLTMGAFFAGLIKLYVSHSAEQSITQRNYQAAIALLDGAPFPDLFSPPGSEPKELLNQALYLDALAKLNAYSEDPDALKELEKIDASSRFFELAQEILKEHFKPSAIQVQDAPVKTEAVGAPKSVDATQTPNSEAPKAPTAKDAAQ